MKNRTRDVAMHQVTFKTVTCVLCLMLMTLSALAERQRPINIVSDIWPPFVMDDPSKPGIDVEVMQAVFERMGMEYSFNIIPWRRAVLEVAQGESDALLDVFKTPDRLKDFMFHQTPLNATSSALFCYQCDPELIVDEQSLKSKVLVINRGYKYGRFGNDERLNRYEVDDFEQGFRMLIAERADYYLVNRVVGLYTLAELKLTDIAPLTMKVEDPSQVFLGFHRSAELLPVVEKFEAELAAFLNSPEHRQILKKYGVLAP